jgi:poly(3-hydroxybutyrate) depolymerase
MLLFTALALATPPVGWSENTVSVNGEDVRYTAFMPENPVGAPLVVSLHYGGEVTPFYGGTLARDVVQPALAALGAVVMAPDCPRPQWADPWCEAAILSLVAAAERDWGIDGQRVILTGYSKGGIGTWALAARHPERFSVALPMASSPRDAMQVRVPTYAIHGQTDELFPTRLTQEAVFILGLNSVPNEFVEIPHVGHYDTSRYRRPLSAAVPWIEQQWAASQVTSTDE